MKMSRMNKACIALLFVYVLVQIIYAWFFPLPFTSDSAASLAFAQSAIQEGTYYPNPSSLYSNGIIAPVYINCLIVLLKISNGQSIILFFNILLNTLQLFLLFKVTEKIFNTRAAIMAGLLYVLYLSNLGLVLLNLTELPFGVLILASLYFFISSPTLVNSLLCGLMTGLALGIRPTAYALVIAFLIIYIVHVFQGKGQHMKMVCIVIGMLIYIIPMGFLSKRNIGQFEFTSASGPANLVMSANPRAKGIFDPYIFKNDSVYLSKKTYVEKNEYLLNLSKDYIKEHPMEWVALIPRKIYSTFISDVWAIPQLLHSQVWDFNALLKGNQEVRDSFNKEPVSFRIAFWVLNIWQQAIYMLIAGFFIYQLYSFVRGRNFRYESLLINLFILGGIALTILAAVGSPRYKYNSLILGIILISPIMVEFMDKAVNRFRKERLNTNNL